MEIRFAALDVAPYGTFHFGCESNPGPRGPGYTTWPLRGPIALA
jgi:hypothetical protein